MGYLIDSLDIRYGTQLADSHGDIGVIFAQGLMHVLIILSPIETLGSPCSSLCGLSIMNYEFALVLFQYELQDRLNVKNRFVLFQYELLNRSIGKNSFEVASYPINNSYLLFTANRNLGVILYCTLRDNYMIQLCQHC